MYDLTYEREREDALMMESMSEGEYTNNYFHHYATQHGTPEEEYVLTPFDVWVKNPRYSGPIGPHPEDDSFHMMTPEEQAEQIAAWNKPKEAPSAPVWDGGDDIPF